MITLLILTINPGSTSTKIGIFSGQGTDQEPTPVFVENIRHSAEELSAFATLYDQLDYRRDLILATVKKAGFSLGDIEGFIGRGGLLRPIESGVYKVNDAMTADLHKGIQGVHASNLGGLLAHAVSGGKGAYIADPVVVDELSSVARISGHPLFKRTSIFHALNQKAIARRHCRLHGLSYNDVNLIVTHMGGGVSVGAHAKGRVIDVNNALDGDGPFSPERSGTLSVGQLINYCFSGKYTEKEIRAMIQPKGGLVAYFNTNDLQEVEEMAKSNDQAALVLDAMAYRVAKEIGAAAISFRGKVDAILLTGGMAYSDRLTSYITDHTAFIAPVHKYPGEDELQALASAIMRVFTGEEEVKVY